jgi:proline iminopeptidase
LVWQEYRVGTPDGLDLAYYIAGDGPPLVWINGGPGEGASTLRTVARSLTSHFTCVLYDQRGCGQSILPRLDAEAVSMQTTTADLEALRSTLGVEQLQIIGHSWGAMLALAYSLHYPEQVARQVLVGMGPLNRALADVSSANIRRAMTRHQQYEFDVLRGQRRVAIAEQNTAAHARIHQRLIADFYAPAWLYSREKAAQFAETYNKYYDFNPYVSGFLMPSWYALDVLSLIDGLQVPTLVLYGYQDVAPITQAYLLAERMPFVAVEMLNECGHIPWLDQPDAFFQAVTTFFDL